MMVRSPTSHRLITVAPALHAATTTSSASAAVRRRGGGWCTGQRGRVEGARRGDARGEDARGKRYAD